jgi:hypothetical protein
MAAEVNMNKVNVPLWTLCTLIKRHPGITRSDLTRMLNFELGRFNNDFLYFFKPCGHTLSRFTYRVRAVPPGRKREVWTYHLREAGRAVADSPKPVAFSERRRRESAPRCHEADWVADAQPGELLTYRKQYGGLFGSELLTLVSKEGVNLITDPYVIQRWGRPIYHGHVSVMLPNGKLHPACAEYLRPALRRTRRLQLDGQ